MDYLIDERIYPPDSQFRLLLGSVSTLAKVLKWNKSLCGSKLGVNATSFWEGSLSVTLEIAGQIIVIDDHDEKRETETAIAVEGSVFRFQGTGVKIYKDTPAPHDVGLYFTVN